MDYLFLISAIIMLSAQHILASFYNKISKKANAYLCTLLIALTVLLFYVVYGQFQFTYEKNTLLFGILFGIAYCVGYIFEIRALAVGSVSLTSLLLSYSLLIPTFFGIVYYRESVRWTFYVALVFLIIALFLINYTPTQKGGKKEKLNLKWLIFTMLSFLGNGICTVSQTVQQRLTGGKYCSEFMIYAMTIVILCNLILTLISNKKEHNVLPSLKKGWWCAVLLGLLNGGTNLFVMLLVGRNILNVSLIYTMISAGGLLLTFVLARLFFKEKLRTMQIIGFFVGILAVVFFNI